MAETERYRDARQIADHLMEVRSTTEDADHKKIAESLLPHRGFWPEDGEDRKTILERGKKIINPAGTLSLERSAGGMTTGMTPEGQPWFGLVVPDKNLMEAPGVRQHLAVREQLINQVLRAGAFYQAIHACNLELFGFGGLLLFADSSLKSIARFEDCTVGTYAISRDAEGQLDTVVRRLRWSVKYIKTKYGEDKMSKAAREMLKEKPYTTIDIMHVVKPRDDYDPDNIDNLNMPYVSYMYEIAGDGSADGKHDVLNESGYWEMPYFYAPFSSVGDSDYGMGAGHSLVGHSRQLNETERLKVLCLQKLISPPTRVPTSFKGRLNVGPGQENKISSNDPRGVGTIYDVPVQGYQYAMQEIKDIMVRIAAVSKADLFITMSEDMRPTDMTLGEFMERKREKIQQVAPVMSLYEPWVLDKLILRTNNMLDRENYFPPAPPALLEAGGFEVEYISSIAKGLRQFGAESTRALVQEVLRITEAEIKAGLPPQSIRKLDLPQAVDEIAVGLGAPARVVLDDATFDKLIEEDKAKMHKQLQAQQEREAAESMAKLGSVPNTGNMASTMLEQQQAGR